MTGAAMQRTIKRVRSKQVSDGSSATVTDQLPDPLEASFQYEVVRRAFHAEKRIASLFHRKLLAYDQNAFDWSDLPHSPDDIEYPLAHNNRTIYNDYQNKKEADGIRPVDRAVVRKGRYILMSAVVEEGQQPEECLEPLITEVNELFGDDNTRRNKCWEYLFDSFRVPESIACQEFLQLLTSTRDSLLVNTGNRQERRGQTTNEREENDAEFAKKFPLILQRGPPYQFWVRQKRTQSDEELLDIPDFNDNLIVLKRIAYQGVRTKLQTLQGARSRQGNTAAYNSMSLQRLIPPGKKIGLGGKGGVKRGKFVKAFFTVKDV